MDTDAGELYQRDLGRTRTGIDGFADRSLAIRAQGHQAGYYPMLPKQDTEISE